MFIGERQKRGILNRRILESELEKLFLDAHLSVSVNYNDAWLEEIRFHVPIRSIFGEHVWEENDVLRIKVYERINTDITHYSTIKPDNEQTFVYIKKPENKEHWGYILDAYEIIDYFYGSNYNAYIKGDVKTTFFRCYLYESVFDAKKMWEGQTFMLFCSHGRISKGKKGVPYYKEYAVLRNSQEYTYHFDYEKDSSAELKKILPDNIFVDDFMGSGFNTRYSWPYCSKNLLKAPITYAKSLSVLWKESRSDVIEGQLETLVTEIMENISEGNTDINLEKLGVPVAYFRNRYYELIK